MGLNYFQEKENKADINISTIGDNIIIAPGMTAPQVTGMPAAWENSAEYLGIDYFVIFPWAAVTLQIKDGANNYGGAYQLAAQQPFIMENTMHLEDGLIALSPNQNFVINLSAAVQVSGFALFRRKMSN